MQARSPPTTVIPLLITRDGGWTAHTDPGGREDHSHPAMRLGARLGMSHTSIQLFLKQLVCRLLQPPANPTEQSFSLALPWFNLGILLGSSLTLTPAGTACTSLKGKVGCEQSCGSRTQPGNCFSFLSSH